MLACDPVRDAAKPGGTPPPKFVAWTWKLVGWESPPKPAAAKLGVEPIPLPIWNEEEPTPEKAALAPRGFCENGPAWNTLAS